MQTYAHQHKDVEGMCAINVHVLCTVGGGKELPVTGFHLKTCHFCQVANSQYTLDGS